MRYRLVQGFILLGWSAVLGVAYSGECNRYAVSASDGYTNVRSEPRVSDANLVAALPAGAIVDLSPKASSPGAERKGWQHVDSPVAGWIHGSQLTAVGCEGSVPGSRDAGLDAIVRLARQARSGDQGATRSFLAMSRGIDGALAEVYVDEISDWTLHEPSTLAAALKDQSEPIRDDALKMIDLGLAGVSLEKRGRFRIEILRSGR
jgi:hypothetical protein